MTAAPVVAAWIKDGIEVVLGRPLGAQSLVLVPVPARRGARLSRLPGAARPERAPRQVRQRNAEALDHVLHLLELEHARERGEADGAQGEARFDVHEVDGGCGGD